MTLLSGWGRYPELDAEVIMPASVNDALQGISSALPHGAMIARGLGRSYGDSSLAPMVVDTTRLDHFLAFDDSTGVLTCSAGVSLAEILNIFVPKGWFLPVTPGTKFVTVGGAIASDVHGKNHHLEGCFSDHVSVLKLITISDGIVECSREVRPELFRASCGGMGLTGIIVEATFTLKPIQSAYIDETTIKARNIEEALGVFDAYSVAAYSVAWIDCLATGAALGRSLIMLGEHAPAGGYAAAAGGHLSMPVNMPGFILNRYSIRAFNALYYRRAIKPVATRVAHYESFFYPLDGIGHWNRMYGKNGFVQYQIVLPKAAGLEGLTAVLKRIAVS